MDHTLLLSLLGLALGAICVIIAVARRREDRAQAEIDRLERELERAERRIRQLERDHDEEYLRRVRAESRLDRVLTSVEEAGLSAPSDEVLGTPVPITAGAAAQTAKPPKRPDSPGRKAAESRAKAAARQIPEPVCEVDKPARNLGGKRILLAEDGEDTRRIVEFLLRGAGAQVTSVGDGVAVVEKAMEAEIRGNGFDLILMDRGLPRRDGLSAVRDLRDGHYRALIVALTASDLEEERVESIEAGCDGFIAKPIDPAHFVELVSMQIEGGGLGLEQPRIEDRHEPKPDPDAFIRSVQPAPAPKRAAASEPSGAPAADGPPAIGTRAEAAPSVAASRAYDAPSHSKAAAPVRDEGAPARLGAPSDAEAARASAETTPAGAETADGASANDLLALARAARAAESDAPTEPILSDYASDDVMAELVAQFVEDLERDMREMLRALEKDDLERIRVLSHQLKGSAGSYGFNALTKPAEALERKARDSQSTREIEIEVESFRALCARVRGPEL